MNTILPQSLPYAVVKSSSHSDVPSLSRRRGQTPMNGENLVSWRDAHRLSIPTRRLTAIDPHEAVVDENDKSESADTIETPHKQPADRTGTPPPPKTIPRDPRRRHIYHQHHLRRHRGYTDKAYVLEEKSDPEPWKDLSKLAEKLPQYYRSQNIVLRLCVFRSSSHEWHIRDLSFNRYKSTDREIWESIRDVHREELEQWWKRIFLFKKLTHILPIEYNANGIPTRTSPDQYPDMISFMHAYHHPDRIRTTRQWVDWIVAFHHSDPDKIHGLEFKEGLWAEKLAAFAVLLTLGSIFTCLLWTLEGGDLQTVFTVMDFVLSALAALVAVIAVYYQAVTM